MWPSGGVLSLFSKRKRKVWHHYNSLLFISEDLLFIVLSTLRPWRICLVFLTVMLPPGHEWSGSNGLWSPSSCSWWADHKRQEILQVKYLCSCSTVQSCYHHDTSIMVCLNGVCGQDSRASRYVSAPWHVYTRPRRWPNGEEEHDKGKARQNNSQKARNYSSFSLSFYVVLLWPSGSSRWQIKYFIFPI